MRGQPFPDPFSRLQAIPRKLHTLWLKTTYPFARFGHHVNIHPSCIIPRDGSPWISIGDDVYLYPHNWLNVILIAHPDDEIFDRSAIRPKIILGSGCNFNRNNTIAAANRIEFEDNVLVGQSCIFLDQNHEYRDPTRPVHQQGLGSCGSMRIGRNSWIGHACTFLCAHGELVLGRNCVVGANSVVRHSFPDYCVIAGNPARIVKRFDPVRQQWISASRRQPAQECDAERTTMAIDA
jgi:acetyltransferase-like isoleucine patch superfamily enzyme